MAGLRECKGYCLAFLDDLREVTAYKMSSVSKEAASINLGKTLSPRQPMTPLDENTTNTSVIFTIEKLSEDIKTLLFTQANKTQAE